MFNRHKRVMFAVVTMAISLAVACATAKTVGTKFSTYSQGTEGEYKRRLELEKKFVSATCDLAEKTNIADARDRCNWFKANVVSVMPIGSELIQFDQSPKTQPIHLLIIMDNHELDKLPDIKAMDEKTEGVGYLITTHPPVPLMLIKYDEGKSKLWMALVAHHELSHAKYYYSVLEDPSPWEGLKLGYDEARAYGVEQEFLDKLGGKKYAALVKKYITLLKDSGPADPIKFRSENEIDLNLAFDDIFGTSDELERRCLMMVFDLEVEFKYIDREHPDEKVAAELKAKKFLEIQLREEEETEKTK